GIAWKGSPTYGGDRHRSLPLEFFAPIADVPGVTLFSLQKGPGSEQMRQLGDTFPIIDWTERIDEQAGAFMDTAALLMTLDLVMCVDTALGHLAGALRRPYWLAVPHVPDWRWTMWGDGSPWYPSLRLFRQKEPGNWN